MTRLHIEVSLVAERLFFRILHCAADEPFTADLWEAEVRRS